ncbi:MAG: hypothetical protein IPL81_09905 [Flavobacteriales bacterium]|nr:hypothetical protein [Flavobacteriales bacterium]
MKHLLLLASLCVATMLHAQVPIIDYSFLAVPPSVLVNKVIVQPDGKILVGGGFTNYAGSGKGNLVRLNSDGTVDATFNPGGSGPDFLVQDIDLMPDGRILIAGNFNTYNGVQNNFVARLFPDGTLDPGFHVPPNSINSAVYAVALHRKNSVLVAGDFWVCSGHSQPHITRFDSTGVVDTTFLVGAGFTSTVYDLLVLPDDRILAGGTFFLYQDNPCGRIALLAPNGLFDPSMDNDPGIHGSASSVRALARQPDGKILVGGYFTYHNSVPRAAIARLDLSGAFDPSFTSPLYPYARVDAIAVQADGHILVGGEFIGSMYDPNVPGPSCLVRMNADGSRDDTYDLGTGLGADPGDTYFVRSIAVQQDKKVLVGGRFTSFDTETEYHQLIRLHESSFAGINEGHDAPAALNAWWNSRELRVTMPDGFTSGARLNVYTSTGQLVYSQRAGAAANSTIGVKMDPGTGLLLVSLEQGNARSTAKVMVP